MDNCEVLNSIDCQCAECQCPCIDCVCMAVCRHRTMSDLTSTCHLVHKYYGFPYFRYKKMKLREVLNPTNPNWSDMI